MSSTNVLKIGLDPGYGSIKVAVANGKLSTCVLPSVVGVGHGEAGAIDLAGLGNTRPAERPHHVVIPDTGEYLVGPHVATFARPIERMDFGRFTDGPELRAMVYAALAQMNVAGLSLGLAIGLPVEMLQNKIDAQAVEEQMRGWLVGSHSFIIDGQKVYFEIVKIRANVAQPLGAWLDWGFDDKGKWAKGAEGRTAPVLIIDQGFNTIDLFAIEDGRPSPRYTAGDTLGMRRAAELIERQVSRQYEISMSLHEADDLVQRHLAGETVTIWVHGSQIKIDNLVRQALDTLAAEVIQFIERVVGRGTKFRIILTGGGALALAPRLQRQYHHAEMAPQPVVANARGLAKLAISGLLD